MRSRRQREREIDRVRVGRRTLARGKVKTERATKEDVQRVPDGDESK